MKRISVLILCLALASLACLQSSTIAEETAMPDATISPLITGAPVQLQTLTNVPTAGAWFPTCAVVIAETALNLRSEMSDQSGILTRMNHGDVVRVLGKSDAGWWLVVYESYLGYARSIYLEERTC
jgi:uncharacterized protein YgiM (DUF1202 family)